MRPESAVDRVVSRPWAQSFHRVALDSELGHRREGALAGTGLYFVKESAAGRLVAEFLIFGIRLCLGGGIPPGRRFGWGDLQPEFRTVMERSLDGGREP